MFCENCGKEIKDGNKFCTNCGVAIDCESSINSELSLAIKNVKCVLDYPDGTFADAMDTIKFGKYPQNDVKGQKMENIEWLVLEKQKDKALLISKYILDCQPYNKVDEETTWQKSSLKSFLALNFDGKSHFESGRILMSEIHTNKSVYGVDEEHSTCNRIFILSIEEIEKYFLFSSTLATSGTKYAKTINNSSLKVANNGNSSFWLRNHGRSKYVFARVTSDGKIDDYGHDAYKDDTGVRPAMWVKI